MAVNNMPICFHREKKIIFETHKSIFTISFCITELGYVVAQSVEALRYKSVGRGFDSRSCDWNFSLTNIPAALWPLGSTQPLTEMSTRNTSWG
jgi:hypothetical protein